MFKTTAILIILTIMLGVRFLGKCGMVNNEVNEIGNLNSLRSLDYVAGKVFGDQWRGVAQW